MNSKAQEKTITKAVAAAISDPALPADAPPNPYTTETTEAARDIITKRGRLKSLMGEDEAELAHIERSYSDERARLIEAHEAALASLADQRADAAGLVNNRQADRMTAYNAYGTVLDALGFKDED